MSEESEDQREFYAKEDRRLAILAELKALDKKMYKDPHTVGGPDMTELTAQRDALEKELLEIDPIDTK